MNRRNLLIGAMVLPVVPRIAKAQDDTAAIFAEFLRIFTEQDWQAIDAIMPEDYAPMYSGAEDIPGRDAWKQRQASSGIYGIMESIAFEPVSVVTAGDLTHALVEVTGQTFSGNRIKTPMLFVLKITDGQIVSVYGAFDNDIFVEQMAG